MDVPRPVALNHIHLTAEDPEAEIRFLCDVLGFQRDPSLPGFVWLGNMQLAVTKGEPVKNPRFHIGFRMDSQQHVDGLRAELVERGFEVSDTFGTGSSYSCSFRDPAGYLIEIYADAGIAALGSLAE
jgi:catechol 2,3-dioxygenase-like lactoylglutathione lyase family enzyme